MDQWEVGMFTQRVKKHGRVELGCEKPSVGARWAILSINGLRKLRRVGVVRVMSVLVFGRYYNFTYQLLIFNTVGLESAVAYVTHIGHTKQ